jgi:enterochelin esterase-like enzyme
MLALLLAPAAAVCQPDRVCEVPLQLSPAAAEALLGSRTEAWWVSGDLLTVIARREGGTTLCCAIQRQLHPIGRGLQAVTVRVPDMERAIFDVRLVPGPWRADAPLYRGRLAPPRPETRAELSGTGARHMIQSTHLGQPRGIRVYVPGGIAPGRRVPAIYLADGLPDEFVAVLDGAVRSGRIDPVVMVGTDSGGTPDPSCAPRCDPRSQEYLIDIPGATPEESRFDAHARFVAEEVIPFVESHYPVLAGRENRATAGYSSGGAWAVTMAARRPDLFGKVIGLSIGWLPAAEAAAGLRDARVFLAAGRLESGRFIERTGLAAERTRAAGADVHLLTPNGGHDFSMWEIAFAGALDFLFRRATAP